MTLFFLIAFGAITMTFAQDQDTASTGYTEETQTETETQSTDEELQEAADDMQDKWEGSTTEAREEANETRDEANETVEEGKDKSSQAGRTISAQIKDEKLESKVGPNGEPIFVNEQAEYYYIDENGKKVMIDKSELKPKK
jgi:ElaB/YqjD/DUF883 family membrane-anchored ribosome-binding protein